MTIETKAVAGDEPPTKRARVEKLKKSDKNRWPQHPNIRNPEQRAKAYVRTSGLLKPKETPALPLQDPSTIKLGRLLGGTDQRARHSAVLQLQAYLKARCDIEKGGLSEMDLLKLWKGLWYTLYMADKAPVQEELSSHIANLIWCFEGTEEEDEYAATAYMDLTGNDDGGGCDDVNCDQVGCGNEEQNHASDSEDSYEVSMEEISNTLDDEDDDVQEDEDEEDQHQGEGNQEMNSPETDSNSDSENDMEDEDSVDDSEIRHCRGAHLASLFVRTYFATLRREWGNMDKYRIDKFYTLTRFLLRECFKYMAKRHWSLGIIRLFNDTIFEEVLTKTPNGLRYHLIDITMEELAAVNASAPMPLTEATFLDCLEPYFGLLQTSEPIVHDRVIEKIMKKFLDDHSVLSDTYLNSESDDEKALIFDQVHVGSVAKFIFDVASDGATFDCHRKTVYGLNKMYYRRLKKVGKDVPLDEHREEEDELVHSNDDFQPPSDLAEKRDKSEVEEKEVRQLQKLETDENDATEKRKKKKNKKKKHQDSTEERVEELKKESTLVVQEKTSPAEGDKKKRKRKDKKENETNHVEIAGQSKHSSEERVEEPIKECIMVVEEQSSPAEGDKKKRKRKDKKKSQDTHADIVGQSEEIVISIQDQLKAKRALSKASDDQLKKKREVTSEDSSSDAKRVKFGRMNLFRSWKASMKGLRDMVVPPSRGTSPEKGILRNKKVTAPRNSKIQKRKKAIDYFK